MSKKYKYYYRGSRARVRLNQEKRNSFPRIILAVLLSTSFVVIGLVFFNPLVWRLDLRSELERSKIASTIYDRHGAAVATLYSKTRLWVAYDQIPQDLSKAFIATEDYRFFLHKGIDFWGIGRALFQDIR
ncbi:MAG TPA: hypothetical protein DDW65_17795, partial [Firmicutes bacterium]|nr:hypothetical protein [Bacillota bacterium]